MPASGDLYWPAQPNEGGAAAPVPVRADQVPSAGGAGAVSTVPTASGPRYEVAAAGPGSTGRAPAMMAPPGDAVADAWGDGSPWPKDGGGRRAEGWRGRRGGLRPTMTWARSGIHGRVGVHGDARPDTTGVRSSCRARAGGQVGGDRVLRRGSARR